MGGCPFRHGVRPDSTSLILVPSEVFVHLTDEDLGAIIGYVRRLVPVDRELPVTHLRPLGRAMLAVGNLNRRTSPHATAATAQGCPAAR